MMRVLLAAILLMVALSSPAMAKEARPMADDPVIEARMDALAKELRCLVCQNQTLADSDADLAKDFRREIRNMMHQGLSDQEIVDFLVERYGDFIRYRPPFKATTALLWVGPGLLFVGGGLGLFLTLRRRRNLSEDVPLSEEELNKVQRMLDGDDKRS